MDYNSEVLSKNKALISIMKKFVLMWILTGVGMAIGSMLPPTVCLIISVFAFVLIIATIFMKKTKVVNNIFFAIPFLLGFAFYYIVSRFVEQIGVGAVIGILVLTVILFSSLGFVGYVAVKKNLSGMGQVLMLALLALIAVSIVAIFFPSELLSLILAAAGVLIFSLFTIYDFNQIRQNDLREEETTGYALDLYLDFLNLFVDLTNLAIGTVFKD